MRVKIIGTGAAGNKGAVCAVKNNIIDVSDVLLINSTLKDIPYDYNGKAVQFYQSYGGCGKERSMSKKLCSTSLQNGTINLEEFLKVGTEEEAELVIVTTSTEGGSGSGSAPLIAKYIRDVLGISVHIYAYTGFEEDARGVKNTVEFFQEMEDTFTVEAVSLKKYLSETNDNRIKAEELANKEFCEKISVLMGLQLRDSEHNIDPTDLLKISTTEGFMIIESSIIKDRIKNRDQFRKLIIEMLDNSKSLDLYEASQKKLAVIINIDKNSTDYIDYLDILTERFGLAYEKFEHIQYEDDMPEFVAIISAGSNMPVKEVEAIYKKYTEMTAKVNKKSDSFFESVGGLGFDEEDSMFDLKNKKKSTVSKDAFFSSTGDAPATQPKKKDKSFNNTKVNKNVIDEY